MQEWMFGAILLAALVLFVTRWLPIEITSLLIPPALVFTGILDVSDALSGFSNPATITVAALFMLSAGLVRTGVLESVALVLGRLAGGSPLRLLLLLALVVPLFSAFMNHTAIVVMLIPVILRICRDFDMAPSKLLIPLSYFSILGGTCTLIGTSTNILSAEYLRTHLSGGAPLGMFAFLPLGGFYVVCGVAFICTIGWRLLPTRGPLVGLLPIARTAKFVTEIIVEPGSPLETRTVGEAFKQQGLVRLIEIVREEIVTLGPAARDMRMMRGDALIIEGASKDIAEFLAHSGARLGHVVEDDREVPMSTVELLLAEAVVLPDSAFVGRTVSGLRLNHRFGVKVLAVQRRGRRHMRQIGALRLAPGDVLLLQAGAGGFDALRESQAVLIVEGLEQAVLHKRRGVTAMAIMALVVALATLTALPIAVLALMGVALMILTRCVRIDEALHSLDASVLLLIACTIPLGLAMTSTGMAGDLVHAFSHAAGGLPPVAQLSAFYLITSLTTDLLSNNATVVLMAPLAFEAAQRLGVHPQPFLMAVTFAASACFMTPIGSHANTIVLGPGGYTFRDFLRIGIPMNLLMWLLASFLIPQIWPL